MARDTRAIIKNLREQGFSISVIAEKLSISRQQLLNIYEENEDDDITRKSLFRVRMTDEQIRINFLHEIAQLPYSEIAEKLDYSSERSLRKIVSGTNKTMSKKRRNKLRNLSRSTSSGLITTLKKKGRVFDRFIDVENKSRIEEKEKDRETDINKIRVRPQVRKYSSVVRPKTQVKIAVKYKGSKQREETYRQSSKRDTLPSAFVDWDRRKVSAERQSEKREYDKGMRFIPESEDEFIFSVSFFDLDV